MPWSGHVVYSLVCKHAIQKHNIHECHFAYWRILLVVSQIVVMNLDCHQKHFSANSRTGFGHHIPLVTAQKVSAVSR
eukprot:5722177-Pleurochrysis_carterae.AAC.3